jgi:hypothetical protein
MFLDSSSIWVGLICLISAAVQEHHYPCISLLNSATHIIEANTVACCSRSAAAFCHCSWQHLVLHCLAIGWRRPAFEHDLVQDASFQPK